MQTITFSASKGGAGKSTLALGVASYLHSKGKKTLVLDLDEQGSLAGWLNNDFEDIPRADSKLLTVEGLKLPEDMGEKISVAASRLAEISKSGKYDYLLIDTKGEQARLTAAIGAISDHVLCPTNGHPFEFEPIVKTYLALEALIKEMETGADPAKVFKVIVTKRRTVESADVRAAQTGLRDHFATLNGPMESASYIKAVQFGTTIDCLASVSKTVLEQTDSATMRANARREYERHTKALEVLGIMMDEILGGKV